MELDDLPDWTKHPQVFACLPCWEEKIFVPIGLTERRYRLFCSNKLILICPRCGLEAQRHETIPGDPTPEGLLWVPSHLHIYWQSLTVMDWWRVPEKDGLGRFTDDKTMSRVKV